MSKYITAGAKIIEARPMSVGEFEEKTKLKLPNGNKKERGFAISENGGVYFMKATKFNSEFEPIKEPKAARKEEKAPAKEEK